jgi:hypothetical protein
MAGKLLPWTGCHWPELPISPEREASGQPATHSHLSMREEMSTLAFQRVGEFLTYQKDLFSFSW